MQETEAAAIAKARTGDGEAFRLLVDKHTRSVFRLGFRLTGNQHDAEDIVQETFLRAYRQLNRYDARASFHTWIYRIASNYALDLLRGRKRMEQRKDETQAPIVETVPTEDPAADRLVYSTQVRLRLSSAMDELSEQERTAFVLRHYEGLSIDQIGESLGLAESATKNSIFRAVQKLRRALEPLMGAAR